MMGGAQPQGRGTPEAGREGGRQRRGAGPCSPAGVARVCPAEEQPVRPALGGLVRAGLGATVSCRFPRPIHMWCLEHPNIGLVGAFSSPCPLRVCVAGAAPQGVACPGPLVPCRGAWPFPTPPPPPPLPPAGPWTRPRSPVGVCVCGGGNLSDRSWPGQPSGLKSTPHWTSASLPGSPRVREAVFPAGTWGNLPSALTAPPAPSGWWWALAHLTRDPPVWPGWGGSPGVSPSSGILVRTTHHLAFPPLHAGGRQRRRKARWGAEGPGRPSLSPVLANVPSPPRDGGWGGW